MTHKNNKRNRRKVVFYYINQFDYKAREKLMKGQLSPKETYTSEKATKVELKPNYQQIKIWILIIII